MQNNLFTTPTAPQELIDRAYELESSIRAVAYRTLKTNSGRVAERCLAKIAKWERHLRACILPRLAQHFPELAVRPLVFTTSQGYKVEVDCSGDKDPLCQILLTGEGVDPWQTTITLK